MASIIENTLTTLKALKPNLSQVYLRSDNAGCYHCAYLLLSLPSIGDRTGVKISRYDFSEPQSGKDICDRRTAVIKSHIRRFLNEGNDVKTASDMKAAIESYGGVRGCYAAVCRFQPSAQTMTKHTMKGMQALHNFSYEKGGMRVWRAYKVGSGKFYSAAQLARFGKPQGHTKLVTVEPFSRPRFEAGTYQQHTQPAKAPSEPGPSQEQPCPAQTEGINEKVVFSCNEEGCIKTFQSFAALQKHMDVGKHMVRLAKESAYDKIARKWTEACQAVGGDYVHGETSGISDIDDQALAGQEKQGWALRKTRKSVAFSEKAKNYLVDLFWIGEETGKKANASDVASKMKSLRDEATGKKMFAKTDWLTEQQIARYFSRLSTLNKSGQLQRNRSISMNEDEEAEADNLAAEFNTVRTRQQIRRELEL